MRKFLILTLLIFYTASCKEPLRNNPGDPGSGSLQLEAVCDFSASDGTYAEYVELRWQDIAKAKEYIVLRKKDNCWQEIGRCRENMFRDKDVVNRQKYDYSVSACFHDSGNSPFSNIDSGYRDLPDPPPPPPPPPLDVPELSCSRGLYEDAIHLEWTAVDRADRYILYRNDSEDGDYSDARLVATNTYTDTSCSHGLRQWYRVKALKGDDLESISTAQWGCTKLTPPTVVSASKASGDDCIVVTYSLVDNASHYRIFIDRDKVHVLCGESNTASFEHTPFCENTVPRLGVYETYYVSALCDDEESESALSGPVTGLALSQTEVQDTRLTMKRLVYDKTDGERFIMGDSAVSSPPHQVRLTRPYYISTTEVSWADWSDLYRYAISDKPCYKLSAGSCGDLNDGTEEQPVTAVSWYDALLFCNLLSEREGLEPCYYVSGCVMTEMPSMASSVIYLPDKNGYRLPTEAEWEYACRALSSSVYFWGEGHSAAEVSPYAWYAGNTGTNSYSPKTKAVALLRQNDFGLFDTSGNASEWVFDSYEVYSHSSQTDPFVVNSSEYRVLRGGSSYSNAGLLMSAYRFCVNAAETGIDRGFRIARNAEW